MDGKCSWPGRSAPLLSLQLQDPVDEYKKHLTVRLYRTGFENSRNSCPTSQVPAFGRIIFHPHHISAWCHSTASCVRERWQSCGTANQSQGQLTPTPGAPQPQHCARGSASSIPFPRPGQDGTEEGKLLALTSEHRDSPREKAKPSHREALQTGLFCHRNITQRSKKLSL